jgi:NOL1/NOP2/fmu family ribosome biogenesis protein
MKSIPWDSSWPEFVSPEKRAEILGFWETRFGVPPALFAPFYMAASSRVTYLIRKSPHVQHLASVRIVRAGIPFTRNAGIYLKPTTEAVQLFGCMATRNTVSLKMNKIRKLCIQGEIRMRLHTASGFVFLKEDEYFWGCALFLEPDRLLCRLPKNIRKELAACVPAENFAA